MSIKNRSTCSVCSEESGHNRRCQDIHPQENCVHSPEASTCRCSCRCSSARKRFERGWIIKLALDILKMGVGIAGLIVAYNKT